MCSVIYGNRFRKKKIVPFEMMVFPEYAKRYLNQHLHYHGVVKLNPAEMEIFNSNYKEIWKNLEVPTTKAFFQEDENKTSTHPVSFKWKSYCMKFYYKHLTFYHFGDDKRHN